MKYIYDEKRAERCIAFVEQFLTHTKGELGGKKFILEDFQKEEIIKPLFGWVDKNGLRRYRTCYIEIPRKNGKSNLSAALAIFMLMCDGEMGAEVVSCAASRSQANIVFSIARQMIINSKELSKRCKIFRNSITIEQNGSFYKSISSDSHTAHGMNISCAIFDELHAQKDRDLWDVVNTSIGARKQPLIIALTTAGFDKQSVCYEISQYATKVRDGIIKDDTFLPILYRCEDGEDWKSEDVWKKCNAGYGTIIKKEYFKQQFNKALNTPSFVNTFKRLHLNIWTGSESAWLTDDEWMGCNISPIDLKKLEGKDCFAGIDLASVRDISALCLLFVDEDENFDVVPFLFVPESKVEQLVGGDGVDYRAWVEQGHIIMTDGNVQDYSFIEKKYIELADRFNIISTAFDRWNSSQLVINLMNEGAKMNPIGMGFISQNFPTKHLESLVLDKKINHGGHPVLRWMMSNITLQTDAAGNIKINKGKSKGKIDGIAALIMALAEYLNTLGEDNDSIYNDRGLIFV